MSTHRQPPISDLQSPISNLSLDAFTARYPFPLDPFQREAIAALAAGRSALVAAPTGTGKTVVAEYAVWEALGRGERVVYTTPLKALSNQKFRDFRAQYGAERVGLMTGDLVENGDAPLVVMTTEVYRNMLLQGDETEVAAVIFDEVHYMADPERGTAWEEAIILAPPSVKMVCLSATVPNAAEIAAWLAALRQDVALITTDERVVPLVYQYFVAGEMRPLVAADGAIALKGQIGGEQARYQRGGWQPRPNGTEGRGEPRPLPKPLEVVTKLGEMDCLPAIYFLFGRRLVEGAASSCLDLPPVGHADELVAAFDEHLSQLPAEDRKVRQVTDLRALLPHGVAFHHAGLLPVLKQFVEEQFTANRLRVVFATDTLALGVNMPARTVVIGELSKFDGERRRMLTPNELKQMAGRAGRRGMDAQGNVVVLYSPLVSARRAADLATAELLPLESAFAPGYNALVNLWQPDIGDQLMVDMTAKSLKRFQRDEELGQAAQERFGAQQRLAQLRAQLEADDTRGVQRRIEQMERRIEFLDAEVEKAEYRARRGARRFVRRLEEVLSRFGYVINDRVTRRGKWLERIFSTNALTLAEMLNRRLLDDLSPEEVAEVVSWFAFDRDPQEAPLLRLPPPVLRARREIFELHDAVLRAEAQAGVAQSEFLPERFYGVALRWAQGATLAEAAALMGLDEGDVVSGLQKTIDLLGQLRDATAYAAPRATPLTAKLRTAERLLRRGVIETAYQMVVAVVGEEASPES